MAKYCPIRERKVLYLDCVECEEKECNQILYPAMNKISTQLSQKSKNKIHYVDRS